MGFFNNYCSTFLKRSDQEPFFFILNSFDGGTMEGSLVLHSSFGKV